MKRWPGAVMATAVEALPAGGLALMSAGLGWVLWAAWSLRRAGTPIGHGAALRVLVEEGPYRFGRNPMALGLLVALVGLALLAASAWLLLPVLVLAAHADRVLIPREEARLQRHFGGWYSDYKANTRRWI